MKKILVIILDIVIFIIIFLAIFLTVMSLTKGKNSLSSIFGYYFFSVKTESMEPTIKKGDLIIGKEYKNEDVKKDDIISFYVLENDRTIIKTHRIKEVYDDGALKSYLTKGDNNENPDNVHITKSDIICRYTNIRIPLLGNIFNFIKSKVGFFITIIIPLFITFMFNLYTLILAIIEDKKTRQNIV
jgi:signal peptidase